MPVFLVVLIGLAIVSPKLLRRLVAVVDTKSTTFDEKMRVRPSEPSDTLNLEPKLDERLGAMPRPPGTGFGRKRV
jgi:hypothetical protein